MNKKVHQIVPAADYVGDYAHNRLVIHIDDEQANIEIFTSFYPYNWAFIMQLVSPSNPNILIIRQPANHFVLLLLSNQLSRVAALYPHTSKHSDK